MAGRRRTSSATPLTDVLIIRHRRAAGLFEASALLTDGPPAADPPTVAAPAAARLPDSAAASARVAAAAPQRLRGALHEARWAPRCVDGAEAAGLPGAAARAAESRDACAAPHRVADRGAVGEQQAAGLISAAAGDARAGGAGEGLRRVWEPAEGAPLEVGGTTAAGVAVVPAIQAACLQVRRTPVVCTLPSSR